MSFTLPLSVPFLLFVSKFVLGLPFSFSLLAPSLLRCYNHHCDLALPQDITSLQHFEVSEVVNFHITFLTVKGQAHNFNKYPHGKLDYLGALYDFQSLMHYGSHAFSKNGKRTIKAIKQTNVPFGQRKGFSETDIQQLNALYDCKSEYMS